MKSVSGSVCVLNKPRGKKNTHSVFEDFFCADVQFEAKTSEVVGEEGDTSLDISPGFTKKPSST